jgi:hypothetical protein
MVTVSLNVKSTSSEVLGEIPSVLSFQPVLLCSTVALPECTSEKVRQQLTRTHGPQRLGLRSCNARCKDYYS